MSLKTQIRVYDLLDKDFNSSLSENIQPALNVFYGNQNDFPKDLSVFLKFLSLKEINRSERFKFLNDKRTYIISHASVNKKISELLGEDFATLKINYFNNRKPYVEQSNLDFNLSHSSDYFAFVISDHGDISVGIDIEVIRKKLNIEPIIESFFHENEINYILKSNSNNLSMLQKFYEIWTRKEAFNKMLGTGLTEEISDIDMSSGKREITTQNILSTIKNIGEAHIYTLKLYDQLMLTLSVNRPVNIILKKT